MDNLLVQLPNFLQNSAISYELLVVFIGYLEGLPIVGSFAPGGTLALIIGAYVHSGAVDFWWSVLGLGIGSFLGDLTGYIVGRFAKKSKLVQRLIAKERVQTGLELFEKKLFLILVFGRMIPLVRSAPSLIAGAHHIKPAKYLTYNLIGSMLWAFVGVMIGMITGKVTGKYAVPIIIVVTTIAVAIMLWRQRKKFNLSMKYPFISTKDTTNLPTNI
jgi:membrane-associated protein